MGYKANLVFNGGGRVLIFLRQRGDCTTTMETTSLIVETKADK